VRAGALVSAQVARMQGVGLSDALSARMLCSVALQ